MKKESESCEKLWERYWRGEKKVFCFGHVKFMMLFMFKLFMTIYQA